MGPFLSRVCNLATPLQPTPALQDLAHTIRKRLAGQPGFSAPKRPPNAFGIDHYAGQVRPDHGAQAFTEAQCKSGIRGGTSFVNAAVQCMTSEASFHSP